MTGAGAARRYHKNLGRPVVAAGDAPEGMIIPSLAAGYLSPGTVPRLPPARLAWTRSLVAGTPGPR